MSITYTSIYNTKIVTKCCMAQCGHDCLFYDFVYQRLPVKEKSPALGGGEVMLSGIGHKSKDLNMNVFNGSVGRLVETSIQL